MPQSVTVNLYKTGPAVFSEHLCKGYRVAGGMRADAPVVISLKTGQKCLSVLTVYEDPSRAMDESR